jgi:hypothetical protein
MRLKTVDGEVYFNPHLISHIHLSSDQSLLTVHFVNGSAFGASTDTHVETGAVADFLKQLTAETSGFVATGSELLNLKSALWVAIPDEGPVQVRSGDNRTRNLENEDRERVRKLMTQ